MNLIFSTVNRLANAFERSWHSDDHVRVGAKAIHVLRYKLPSVTMR